VVVLFAGALVASGERLPGLLAGLGHSPARPTAPASSHPTATPACPARPVDPHAASALTAVQLTTGLQDPAEHDYRPVNHVSVFAVGQYLYITFQLATDQAGTISASICTPGTHAAGTRSVPAGELGARGEFNLGSPQPSPLGSSDVGSGVAVLSWNGAVAAAAPFTVVAN
jgi:hypothetical protein